MRKCSLRYAVERRRPPLDDDLAAVRSPPRRLDSRRAAGLDGGEERRSARPRSRPPAPRAPRKDARSPHRRRHRSAASNAVFTPRSVTTPFGSTTQRSVGVECPTRSRKSRSRRSSSAWRTRSLTSAPVSTRRSTPWLSFHRGQRPGDVDRRRRRRRGSDAAARRSRPRPRLSRNSAASSGAAKTSQTKRPRTLLVVRDAGRACAIVSLKRIDAAFEIDDAEERGRRVHDVAHEVALALELVEPGAELRLQAVAVEGEPRRDGNRLEQLRLVEQRAVVHDDRDGLAGLARDHRRDALDVVGRHLEAPCRRDRRSRAAPRPRRRA